MERKKKLIEIDGRTEKRISVLAKMADTRVKPYIESLISNHPFNDINLEFAIEDGDFVVEYNSTTFDLEDRKIILSHKLEAWYNLSEYGYWSAIHHPTNQEIDGIIPFTEFCEFADDDMIKELLLDYLIHNDLL